MESRRLVLGWSLDPIDLFKVGYEASSSSMANSSSYQMCVVVVMPIERLDTKKRQNTEKIRRHCEIEMNYEDKQVKTQVVLSRW